MSDAGAGRGVVHPHDVVAAAECADCETAANNLAQRGHVGGDAVVFLGTARGYAEADNLVEYQHDAVFGGELPQHCQEIVAGGQHSHGAEHGFDDDGRQLVLVALQNLPRGFCLVEGNHHHGFEHAVGQTFGGGQGVGMQAFTGLAGVYAYTDAHDVVAAVVAALGLGDEAAACEGPGGADGVERGLSARVGETHQVEARNALAEDSSQSNLVPVGGVVHHPLLQLLANGVHYRLRPVPQYQGGHRADEIQPVGAIGIHDVSARRLFDENGVRFPEDGIAAVSSGEVALRFFPRRPRLGGEFQIAFSLVAHVHASR